jgi:hypothetical protein
MELGMLQRSYLRTDTACGLQSYVRSVGLKLISRMVDCMSIGLKAGSKVSIRYTALS